MHYSKWQKTTVKVENMVATLHIWKLHIFLGIKYKHTYYKIITWCTMLLCPSGNERIELTDCVHCNWMRYRREILKPGRRANDHLDKDAKFDTWWNFKVLNHWMRLRGQLFLSILKKCNCQIARYEAKY